MKFSFSLAISAFLFVTFAHASAQAPATETAAQTAARLAVGPPEIENGDYDAALLQILQFVDANPESPFSSALLSRSAQWFDRCADLNRILKSADEILRTKNPTCGAELRLRVLSTDLLKRKGDESALLDGGDRFPGAAKFGFAIGPFGDEFPSAIQNVYKPEEGLLLTETTVGKRTSEKLDWKPVSRRNFESHFDLQDVGSVQSGVYYLRLQVKSSARVDAFLSLTTPGSTFAWWNGEQKYRYDADSMERETLTPKSIVVHEGWNQLLIKLEARGATWASIRIIDSAGRTIQGLSYEEKPIERGVANSTGSTALEREYVTPEASLSAELEKPATDVQRANLLAFRALVRLGIEKQSKAIADLRAALVLDPNNANLWFTFAESCLNSGYLPEVEAKNRAREAVDAALKIQSKHIPALLLRADLLARDDRMEEALAVLKECEKNTPNVFLVPRQMASVFRRLNWHSEKLKALRRAVALAPNKSELHLEAARESQQISDFEAQSRHLDLAASIDASNRAISSEREQIWHSTGQDARVLAERERFVRLYKSRYERKQLADAYEKIGKLDLAQKTLEALVRDYPNDTNARISLAEFLRARSKDDVAKSEYQRVAELVPGNSEVRTWLRETGVGLADDEFFNQHRPDVMKAIREYTPSKEHEKAPDVLVVDHQMERVLPDGSVESEISAVYRINDQTGVDQHGEASFSGELLELKVVHPDGSIDEPTPAKGSYALPNLKPGNFILVRSRVYSEAAPGSTPRLGNFQFQSLERPYVLSQYVLSLPKNSDLRLIERNFDGEHDITESDAEITHQFTKRNSPRIMPERSAPDPMRFLPWVQAGISKTHAQLNRSFRTQLRTMDVSEEIKEAAANAVAAANAKNDRDVAKCLYQFTNDTLLERGGGTATRSLLEKRGNPVALYGALLKARSVPFDYVYVRAIPEGGDDEPEPEFLDASRYHRVLFRIHPREGGEPIWVDVSLKLQPFGERPAALSGSEAFVTNEYNPEIIKLPLLPDDESIPLELLSSFELRGGQTAVAKVQLTLHNEQSWGAREQIRNQTADIKKTIASQISNQFVEGVELINFDFPNMSDASSPLKFIFEGNVNNFLRQGTSGLEAPSVVRPIPLAKQFAGRSKRKLPVRLRVVQLFKENVTVTPGEMQTFGEIPKDVIKNGFGIDYQLRFKQAGGSLMIERTLKLTPVTIPAEDYPSFMALCREIEEAELSKIPVNEKK